MTSLEAALLGIIQGLTEFLPISSSAHLILTRSLFGWDAGEFGLAFDVACHVGTLIAVLVFFRRDIQGMVAAVPAAARGAPDDSARLVRSIVVGTLPIVFVGLLFADLITSRFRTPGVAAFALAVGALVMVVAERVRRPPRAETSLTSLEAFGLGLAQAAALIPGVSRSGAVLTLAMLFGIRRERAARFSFLLGIPAIVAAAAKQALDLIEGGIPPGALWLFVVGIVTSAVVGYLTVKYFIQYLVNHSLDVFAGYRLGLAACIVLVLLG
ncbi:MAG: undecaprenyl-diphosphate phosphatase [Chloroflexi bacterium]|nr:undecaprenyl-diphosphate phosphatase [Chloroflexota bacterium]